MNKNQKIIAKGEIERGEYSETIDGIEWGIYDEEKDIWIGFEKIIQKLKENKGKLVKIILEEKK